MSTYTPCEHGTYYDCEHGCEAAHLQGDAPAVEAARLYNEARFERMLDVPTATRFVADRIGATMAEVGPLVGRGVGIMGASRD